MPTVDLLKALLFESVAKLYANDYYLIARGGMENACQARVMYYMQDILFNDPRFIIWRNYNVDCEYNKNIHGMKELPCAEKYVRPDLLLHIRDTNDYNLLVVEFKLAGNVSAHDMNKLKDLTNCDLQYRYLLGVAVKLSTHGATYTFIANGEITETVEHTNTWRNQQ